MNQVSKAHGKGIHTQKMTVFYSSFLFHSGVRAGFEALGIKWSDLDYTSFGDLYCVIRDGKTKNYEKNNRNVIFDLFAEDCIHHAAQEKYSDLLRGMDKRKVITYLINKNQMKLFFLQNLVINPLMIGSLKNGLMNSKRQRYCLRLKN